MIFSISLFIFCFYLFNRIFPSGQAAEEATLREGWFIIIFLKYFISFRPFSSLLLFCYDYCLGICGGRWSQFEKRIPQRNFCYPSLFAV